MMEGGFQILDEAKRILDGSEELNKPMKVVDFRTISEGRMIDAIAGETCHAILEDGSHAEVYFTKVGTEIFIDSQTTAQGARQTWEYRILKKL